MVLNVDLHSHSTQSDGSLRPAAVAERAKARGVDWWALSDHDALSGLQEAAEAARELDLGFIPGVEISVLYSGVTVHIVGLNFNPADTTLQVGLAQIRQTRFERARQMGDRLQDCGVEGAFDGALSLAGNPHLIGRVHFARYLIQQGVCDTFQQAFERYLGDGKRACVPMQGATLEEAVGWILSAGGKAVIAHPGRYPYKPARRKALFSDFKALGGQAIEVVTGSHTPDQYRQYARVAREYGFEASRGSDFHAPGMGRVDLGLLPDLPYDLVPVWRDWIVEPGH
ncbi:MAG TPA: PHP domain-containing protein [Castellaniella sp.]|uniref:PHP domain-containing protein n=1 Tax=Castellaniella sp. TaxID=1955812 RepID=UPI002EE0B19C